GDDRRHSGRGEDEVRPPPGAAAPLRRARGSRADDAVAGSAGGVLRERRHDGAEHVTDLCFWSARELAGRLRIGELSAREVMQEFLAQIARVNPTVNAIVAKLDDDACMTLAAEADQHLAGGDDVGPLHGLPIAFKD